MHWVVGLVCYKWYQSSGNALVSIICLPPIELVAYQDRKEKYGKLLKKSKGGQGANTYNSGVFKFFLTLSRGILVVGIRQCFSHLHFITVYSMLFHFVNMSSPNNFYPIILLTTSVCE